MSGVEVRVEGRIRHVTLDCGPRNALTVDAVEGLAKALAPDEASSVAILRGSARAFSVGLDNATLARGGVEATTLLTKMGQLLLDTLESPMRIIAACEGHAVAAGAMLLLISDVRIGVPGNYKIGFTEPRIGMPLPELPALLARERLDRRRLHELTALGRTVGPEDAVAAGFLDAVVAPEALAESTLAHAQDVAALDDAVYAASLRSAWGETLGKLHEQMAAQQQALERLRAAADAQPD